MSFSKPIKLDRSSARLRTYYDTQQIDDTTSDLILNFFPPNPNKVVGRNNYVQNPFPGDEARMVIGLSFELTKQAISRYPLTDASSNTVDPEKIGNGIMDSAVLLRVDNNFQEMLKVPMIQCFNFAGTDYELNHAVVGDPGTGGSAVTHEEAMAVFKSASGFVLPDPFVLASQQHLDLSVHFHSKADFPSDAEWTAASQGNLYLRAKLYVAEMKKGAA